MKKTEVAAAVLTRPDGSFLLGQRAAGTFYPGYWEFPGGKLEAGESAAQALVRELREELEIEASVLWPWVTREFQYPHAHVRLHFFEVPAWQGALRDHVHAALAWQRIDALTVGPMLPANAPVLKALALPRQMGITCAGTLGPARQLAALDQALARGLKLIQVREPGLPPAERVRFARAVVARAHAAGAWVVFNGDEADARASGADGIHLSAARLMASGERPAGQWVGASCHNRAELEHAATLGLDYALLGPLKPTPTHPEAAGLGWAGFAERVRELPLPVLALGGLTGDDLPCARAAGAHGIAAIRASWPADGTADR